MCASETKRTNEIVWLLVKGYQVMIFIPSIAKCTTRLSMLILASLVFTGITHSAPTIAQNEPVTISLNLPVLQYEYLAYSGLVEAFEEAHPDIRIYLVRDESFRFIQSTTAAEQLAETADIVVIESDRFTPEVTLGGAFLDLSPLLAVDDSLNIEDFYPAVWQAFQWDGGVWAVPLNFHLIFLSYAPAAFDQAGVAYPDADWTITDLAEAAQMLAVKDDEGNVVAKGLALSSDADRWLLRSLLGENLFDESSRPAAPRLNTSAAAELLPLWNQLHSEGLIGMQLFDDKGNPPMSIDSYLDFGSNSKRAMALLPGGRAGMRVNGLAISAGTLYPEQAYEFVKFLSYHPEVLGLYGMAALPARTSLEPPASWDYLDQGVQDLIVQAIPVAIPLSELRYTEYFARAVYRAGQGMTPQEALQAAEDLAKQSQQFLLDRRETLALSVAPPPSVEEASSGQITLRFGFHAFAMARSLPNQSLWDSVIEDFVANDPQVGRIDMEALLNPVDFTETFDCFFTPRGVDTMQPDVLLTLDPLMAADPNFDASDFVPGALEFVRFNNQTYGYPLVVQLEMLSYDESVFKQAGVPIPENTWTLDEFADALYTLKSLTGNAPVFSTTRYVSTDLQQVIAAYGGLPIDYRTDPPTPDFTDPTNVDAIRSVLDLARGGYIYYVPRAGRGEVPATPPIAPIMPNSLGMIFFSTVNTGQVLYPHGSTYTPIGMGVGALYINRSTLYPEACYRWISTIAAHPGLIGQGMPARHAHLDSQELLAAQGAKNVELYHIFYDQLQSSNAVFIPSPWVGSASLTGSWLEYWLYEAFSAYVMDDADLEQVLAEAQIKAEAYIGCVGNLPERDPSQDYNALYELYTECAVDIDPSIPRT